MTASPSESIDPEAGLRFALAGEKELHESEDLWLAHALAADRDGDPHATRYWNHLFTTILNLDDARERIAYFSEQLALAGVNPHAIIAEMRSQETA